MQNSNTGRKLAAAMFLGASGAAMVAGTAHADNITGATVDPHYLDRGSVALNDHVSNTALIGLNVPGTDNTKKLWTYCIERSVVLNPAETYDEHDWASEQARIGIDKQHLEGIKWILNNSFPQVSVANLAKDSGVSGLTELEAVESTQAAIWHFEDSKTTLGSGNKSDVVDLYNWLVTQATGHMNDSDQPQASLSVGPAIKDAAAGSRVSFTLTSSDTKDAFITVALSGPNAAAAKIVDSAGNPVDAKHTYKSGDKVYVQLPAGAAGSLTLNASGDIGGFEAGRVFVSHDNKPSQNLILAQAQNIPVSASTTVNWIPVVTPPTTPPPSHPTTPPVTLAHTGAGNSTMLAGGALTLIGAGGGMMVFARRPRKAGSHA